MLRRRADLLQQFINHADQRTELLGIVEAGEHDDAAIAVDKDIARDARLAQGILGKDIGTGVERQGIGHLGGLGKGKHLLQWLVAVDAQQVEAGVGLMTLPDVALDEGHFLAANATPAGGELKHDDLATKAGEGDAGAVGKGNGEIGCHVAYTDNIARAVSLGFLCTNCGCREQAQGKEQE